MEDQWKDIDELFLAPLSTRHPQDARANSRQSVLGDKKRSTRVLKSAEDTGISDETMAFKNKKNMNKEKIPTSDGLQLNSDGLQAKSEETLLCCLSRSTTLLRFGLSTPQM